jgi:hypothetical protein
LNFSPGDAYARFSEVKQMKHRDGLSRRYRHL